MLIKKILKRLKNSEDQGICNYDLYSMTILSPSNSGTSAYIYISQKQGKHSARIKIAKSNKELKTTSFSVSISDKPEVKTGKENITKILRNTKELDEIFQWIILNKKTLLAFWNGEINDSVDLIKLLKKV